MGAVSPGTEIAEQSGDSSFLTHYNVEVIAHGPCELPRGQTPATTSQFGHCREHRRCRNCITNQELVNTTVKRE